METAAGFCAPRPLKCKCIAIGRFAQDVLVADVRFVLDRLEEMNAHDKFWGDHMDLSKIEILGHSMGGTTAALATKEERRILAGANLDGSTFPGMNEDIRPVELQKPLLFLATEEHAADPGARAREYSGSESNTYYVVVPGSDHMNFTDARLVSGPNGSCHKLKVCAAVVRCA
jgi:predicted dienelactone hydrolase